MKDRQWIYSSMVCVAMGLAGCAVVTDRGTRLFASQLDAVVIVNSQLLHGTVSLVPDRTGTLNFNGGRGSISTCFGSLRYTASTTGMMDLHCNDGTAAQLSFSMLSDARGYAYSQSPTTPASLVFGLSYHDAMAYLTVPAGKKLVELPGTGLELQ